MSRLSFAVVLPAIDPTLSHECLSSMHSEMRRHTFLIDNEGMGRISHNHRHQVADTFPAVSNLGVPVSWNEGIGFARKHGVQYLLIVSQSIKFGKMGGVDFLAELEQRKPEVFMGSQFGWKCCAIPVALFDEVGMFDPIYSPAYREEIDWMWRLHLAGYPSPRANDGEFDQITIDATSAGDAMTLQKGLVEIDFGQNTGAFIAKWGSEAGPERWRLWQHPYNDRTLDWRFIGPYAASRERQEH